MAYKRRRAIELRTDKVAWAVKEFIVRAGCPLEFKVILSYFNSEAKKKYVREALDIDFAIRPEFMVMSIERPNTGISTRWDGDVKLVTLTKWGFGRKPLLAAEMRAREKQHPAARVISMRGYKVHIG